MQDYVKSIDKFTHADPDAAALTHKNRKLALLASKMQSVKWELLDIAKNPPGPALLPVLLRKLANELDQSAV